MEGLRQVSPQSTCAQGGIQGGLDHAAQTSPSSHWKCSEQVDIGEASSTYGQHPPDTFLVSAISKPDATPAGEDIPGFGVLLPESSILKRGGSVGLVLSQK